MNRWLEIDTNAFRNNLSLIKNKIGWPKVKLMPVIKANAYGHGLIELGKICEEENADHLAIATVDEGVALRKAGIKTPILNIGYTDESEIEEAIKNDIAISVYDIDMAKKISKLAKSLNKKAKVHLKLDTGMHRLGFMPIDYIVAYKNLINDPNLELEYIYSHFADIKNHVYSQNQKKVLDDFIEELKEERLPIPKIHFCRSESLLMEETFYDMVRPGLAIYGIGDIEGLKPVLTYKAKVAQVKEIKKGDSVGYDLTFNATKDMSIATLAVGYADGYGRNFSNKGEVLIGGKRCNVIGRVCMNLTIVDISNIPSAKMGDEVVLIGKQGSEEVTAKELAAKIETNPYEIVARIPAEIPRIYK